MRILITNDDGVHAEGLAVLERVAATLSDDVTVVAPEIDQSGVAHSLSLNDPLRRREISPRRFALKGTPTDCVIMGVRLIMKDRPPDLILSGVNRGLNVAEDVTYSGTIAGAMEGTLLGIPSIALSQGYRSGERANAPFACAETHAPSLIRKLLEAGIPSGILVNVNFPGCGPKEVTGIAVAMQGRRDPGLAQLEERQDGRGIPYFWIRFARNRQTPQNGSDLAAVAAGKISVTPLRLDLTDEPTLTRYARFFD
jgi:5'-nucleotidase